MSIRQRNRVILGFLIIWTTTSLGTPTLAKTDDPTPTRYLAFQVFTGSPSPNIPIGGSGSQPLSAPPSKATLKQFVQGIIDQIGTTGDQGHKLAFIIGPLA